MLASLSVLRPGERPFLLLCIYIPAPFTEYMTGKVDFFFHFRALCFAFIFVTRPRGLEPSSYNGVLEKKREKHKHKEEKDPDRHNCVILGLVYPLIDVQSDTIFNFAHVKRSRVISPSLGRIQELCNGLLVIVVWLGQRVREKRPKRPCEDQTCSRYYSIV